MRDFLLPFGGGRVVELNKSDEIRIPIHPMNRTKDILGEDEFECVNRPHSMLFNW